MDLTCPKPVSTVCKSFIWGGVETTGSDGEGVMGGGWGLGELCSSHAYSHTRPAPETNASSTSTTHQPPVQALEVPGRRVCRVPRSLPPTVEVEELAVTSLELVLERVKGVARHDGRGGRALVLLVSAQQDILFY